MQTVKVDQSHLSEVLKSLFPASRIIQNARKKAGYSVAATGGYLELDIWLPDFDLAFEYQDPHHYLTCTWYSHTALSSVQQQDDTKRNTVSMADQTLIVVPCWWDGGEASLAATIKTHRPDLLRDYHPPPSSPGGDCSTYEPIAPNPPTGFFTFAEHAGYIPNVGKVTLASFTPSALFNPTSWWMSEKYDGLRACWNTKKLYSRIGRNLFVPPSCTANFPAQCLDGELWFGREQFNEAQKVARLNAQLSHLFGPQGSSRDNNDLVSADIAWCDIRFLAFDCPALEYHQQPFEERYTILLSCFDNGSMAPVLEIVATMKCASKKKLKFLTEQVLSMAGEGTVLRRPSSTYDQGRSNDLIKFKTQRDSEGLLVSKNSAEEFVIKLPGNITFVANLASGGLNPQVGDVVTFTYSAYSGDRPTNAEITRVRHDVDWESISADSGDLSTDVDMRPVNQTSRKGLNHPAQRQSYGYWTTNESENVRKFFDAFAQSRGRDPLDPQSWYSVTGKQICAIKGGNTVMAIYRHSLKRALMDTYPNIGLIETKFPSTSKIYWRILGNRRRLLDGIAARLSFDPLIPDNWYDVPLQAFKTEPGGVSLLKYYGYSHIKALVDIYPDIGLDPSHFRNMLVNHWKFSENRRNFFDGFATRKAFDPLIASNWYFVLPHSVLLEKGGGSVLYYYQGSLSAALMDLYPDIGLHRSEFKYVSNSKPRFSKAARRNFFDNLAKTRGFDPLLARNWYSVSTNIVKREQNGGIVLKYYRGSVIRALQDLYPNIGLLEAKFNKVTNKFWRIKSNAKRFFDEFASNRRFDPLVPNNWNNVSPASVIAAKGGSAILRHYNDSLDKALTNIYQWHSTE